MRIWRGCDCAHELAHLNAVRRRRAWLLPKGREQCLCPGGGDKPQTYNDAENRPDIALPPPIPKSRSDAAR